MDEYVLTYLALADDTWLLFGSAVDLNTLLDGLRRVAWGEAGQQLRLRKCTLVSREGERGIVVTPQAPTRRICSRCDVWIQASAPKCGACVQLDGDHDDEFRKTIAVAWASFQGKSSSGEPGAFGNTNFRHFT